MKKRASISILLLFVFLLISLSFLFLFTQLEQRIAITDTVYDRAQSSYIGESTAYQYLSELDLKNNFNKLQREGAELKLTKKGVLEGKTSHAVLKTVREEEKFNSFELELWTIYQGIQSTTLVHGRWIDPIFYQKDGYLTGDEIEDESLLRAITENFEVGDSVFLSSTTIHEPMELAFEGTSVKLQTALPSEEELSPSQVYRLPIALNVQNQLKVNNQGTIQGLVRVKDGGTIEGNFHVKGVLILEPGAKSYGKIDVYGLCIDLGGDTEGIYSVFSKEETIRYLKHLDGFINPQVISLEKH